MATKHTPAPWIADKNDVWAGKNNADKLVCVCYLSETKTADSKLIAQAPEMYAELEKCAKLLRDYEAHHLQKGDREKADRNGKRAENCERVLAKARGES